ncbi:MAG: phenylalanine--tRNA ligase subunit beta [Candidatus Kapaibacteriota bacterium]
MKISLKWLKEFIDLDVTPDEIDKVLTDLGIEVEKILDNKEKYNNFYVGLVTKSEEVADSDHLHYCEVSTGNNNYKVICGAPNVAVGQKVVLGTVGAIVPANGLKLEKRKIRGLESTGMICSKYELEIDEDHSGIWVLPNDAKEGTPLFEYLQEDDVIFEISVTPNRGDCLSHLGIARELAAFYRKDLKLPNVHLNASNNSIHDFAKVEIVATEKNPRYIAKMIQNVEIKESPEWLKKKLISVDIRPINNVVDITNLILMEFNQPLHAFDFDKIEGGKIVIKTANEKEKFTTLDSKERILDSEMLMICDAKKSIAIAGVMGGENSEITNSTKNVLLEAAYFQPSSIRRTAKKLGIQSEASYRFERGVDIDNLEFVANRAAQLIAELSGGTVLNGTIDIYPNKITKNEITLRFQKCKQIIGYTISNDEILDLLKRLNFKITRQDDNSINVIPPSYRNDIQLEIDIIEEIARLFGYDNIQPQYFTQINFNTDGIPENLAVPKLRNSIRSFLANRGFNEILTQNMIEPSAVKFFTEEYVEISNPLGEELSIMRPSMIPSVLKSISNNIRVGNNSLKFFEIGKVFLPTEEPNTFVNGVREAERLIVAFYGTANSKQWGIGERNFDFYDAKGLVNELMDFLKIKKFKTVVSTEQIPGFSAKSLIIQVNKKNIGVVGEISKELIKYYDIDNSIYIIQIDLDVLYKIETPAPKYQKISPYPPILRDLAFIVDKEIPAGNLQQEIANIGGNYLKELNLFDLYEGKQIPENKKSVAFNLVFSSETKTLTDEEIEPIINKIIQSLETKFGAIIRKS